MNLGEDTQVSHRIFARKRQRLTLSWDEIGLNSRRAAQVLKDGHARSSVSRAYYSAFYVVNERLLRHASPPAHYETHRHQQIPDLIEAHLLKRNAKARRALRTTVVRLYKARLDADYKRRPTMNQAVALDALRDAKAIFNVLGVSDA